MKDHCGCTIAYEGSDRLVYIKSALCDSRQLRAELSEAIDVIEALVLQGAYLGSKPMQRANDFVKRMKESK